MGKTTIAEIGMEMLHTVRCIEFEKVMAI